MSQALGAQLQTILDRTFSNFYTPGYDGTQTVTVRQRTFVFNTATNVNVPTNVDTVTDAIFHFYSLPEIASAAGLIQAGDIKILLRVKAATVFLDLKVKDQVVIDSDVWNVVSIEKFYLDAVVSMLEVQARR